MPIVREARCADDAGGVLELGGHDGRAQVEQGQEGVGLLAHPAPDDEEIGPEEVLHVPVVPRESLGPLLPAQLLTLARTRGGAALGVVTVELEVAHTEPGLQGDRSTGGTKPATLETGAEIQVPLFLETGNVVKVDTRTGEYLSRVNN